MAEELKPHHYWREDRITGRLVVITPDEYEQWGKDNQPSEAYRPAFTCAQLPSQGGEAVEVVAHLYIKPDGKLSMDAVRHKPSQAAEPVMTVAQHQRILAASVGSAEPVAWAICKEPGRVDWLSATYANKRAAEAHVASYKNDLTLYITPLYTHPADQVADDLTMVKVSRELLEELRDCANECYNSALLRGTSGIDSYEHFTEQADALLNGGRDE